MTDARDDTGTGRQNPMGPEFGKALAWFVLFIFVILPIANAVWTAQQQWRRVRRWLGAE